MFYKGSDAFLAPKFSGNRVLHGFCLCFWQLVVFYIGAPNFQVVATYAGFDGVLATLPCFTWPHSQVVVVDVVFVAAFAKLSCFTWVWMFLLAPSSQIIMGM